MGRTIFRRYTYLPFLLDILYEKRLPLLDPSTWEDKNDSYYLELYKKAEGFKSLLAICFTEAAETYHHWKIYAGNTSGVCIEFHKQNLIDKIKEDKDYQSSNIFYRRLNAEPLSTRKLPFIKRIAFKDEQEYRMIYSSQEEITVKYLPIKPGDIESIIINPWVDKSVTLSIKSTIKSIDGCSRINVTKSTVVDNEQWKKQGNDHLAFID